MSVIRENNKTSSDLTEGRDNFHEALGSVFTISNSEFSDLQAFNPDVSTFRDGNTDIFWDQELNFYGGYDHFGQLC